MTLFSSIIPFKSKQNLNKHVQKHLQISKKFKELNRLDLTLKLIVLYRSLTKKYLKVLSKGGQQSHLKMNLTLMIILNKRNFQVSVNQLKLKIMLLLLKTVNSSFHKTKRNRMNYLQKLESKLNKNMKKLKMINIKSKRKRNKKESFSNKMDQ